MRLYPLLSLPGLKIPNKRQVVRALDLYDRNADLDFEDALSVAAMERQGIAEIYSYDENYDRLQGCAVTRLEP